MPMTSAPPTPAPSTGPSRRRVLAARTLAVVVDGVQLVLSPAVLVPAVGVPLIDALDLAVAAAMVALLGWHWAFLPTVVAEGLPLVDVAPSWTLAVLWVTRGQGKLPAGVPPAVESTPLPPGR
jgi:hypothetical protein